MRGGNLFLFRDVDELITTLGPSLRLSPTVTVPRKCRSAGYICNELHTCSSSLHINTC